MHHYRGGLYALVFLAMAAVPRLLSAEEAASGPAAPAKAPGDTLSFADGAELIDYYYHVVSDGGSADAAAIVKELELRFAVYNRLFRFNPSLLNAPLKVRAFKEQQAYDDYVAARLGKTRPGAVYLHYSQEERRELIIHRGSAEERQMIPHQAFIQFIRAFIPNPPAWLREGFAIYFSTLHYNPKAGELAYEENLSWLDFVKGLGDRIPPLEAVFLADIQGVPDNFQPVAWSLISFFLNNGGAEYFRTLTGVFTAMSRSAPAPENAESVLRYMILWTDLDTLRGDYQAYLDSRKTFTGLVQDGQKAYASKDPASAEASFTAALDLKPNHYAPYYYLGLLAYEEKRYGEAEEYYQKALQYGADPALIHYAQGLNAASAGQRENAIHLLNQAAEASPDRYKARVESLLQRLQ